MADPRAALASKFLLNHRYVNFGPCLREMSIDGFRGIKASISFDYPVTAITGLNGAGKSTLGQLALCAYRKVSTETLSKRFYVKDFFPVSIVDPKPFSDNASVIFRFETDDKETPQDLTVSRATKEWSGYKRQPERHVEYIGLAFYIPKVERKDLTIYSAGSLTMSARQELTNAGTYVSRILGGNYEEIFFQGVESTNRKAQLGVAKRFGAQYSENNMGFGEGRVIHTIKVLETCKERSLIVLEEPETSLHEHAQYEFSKYLIDVSLRRGHQIIYSTHSSPMLAALPPEARKMLARDTSGVTIYDRISSAEVRSALSAGMSGKIVVCVEDAFAQSMLREILKRRAPDIRCALDIIPFGDAKAVSNALSAIKLSGVKAMAVRDADQSQDLTKDHLTLPGTHPPEKEVLLHEAAKKVLIEDYDFDLDSHLAAHPNTDHHNYSKIAAEKSSSSREVIEADCIRSFLDEMPDDWSDDLIAKIKERIH